jgi:hypothetical protein
MAFPPDVGTRFTGRKKGAPLPQLCMAALFSRIVSGPFHFRRRFLFILGIGLLSPIVAFLLVIVIAFPPVWAGSIHVALLLSVLVVEIIGIAYGLHFVIRSTGERSIEGEAARWLAERQSGSDPSERRRRSRAICWALWIPACAVLLAFLFFRKYGCSLSSLSTSDPNSEFGRISGPDPSYMGTDQ